MSLAHHHFLASFHVPPFVPPSPLAALASIALALAVAGELPASERARPGEVAEPRAELETPTGVPVPGEPLPEGAIALGVVESMETVLAREAALAVGAIAVEVGGSSAKAPEPADRSAPAAEAQGAATAAVATLPNLLAGFAGPDFNDPGANWVPADLHGAVGPNHFVAVTNEHLSVYDKATTVRVLSTSLDAFFGGNASVPKQDPRVIYDHHADRWGLLASDRTSGILFAWTTSNDPTGSWFKTSIVLASGADAGTWPEYPVIGFDLNGVYVSAHMVGNSMSLFAIDKAPLMSIVPGIGTVSAWRSLPYEGALQPCVTFDVPTGCYVTSRFDLNTHRIRRIDPPVNAPTLVQLGFIDTKNGQPAPDAEVLGSTVGLETLDARHMSAVHRGTSIWVSHHVDKAGRSAINWYEFDPLGLAVVQEGTVKSDTQHYSYPSLAVDSLGNAVLGFTASSPSMYASAWYTGRRASDPLGEMAAPVEFRGGAAPYNQVFGGKNLWGEASATSADFLDDSFWTIQPFAKGTNLWGTQVAQLGFTGCPPPSATAPTPVALCPGGSASFSTVAGGTAPFTYQWLRNGSPVTGATAASLSLPSVTVGDAGVYACVVTDACSSVTSPSALLTVHQPATASAPLEATVCTGGSASFSTTPGGTGPFTFQWRKDGLALPGATASTYTIASAQPGDLGAYDVVVTGLCSATTSAAAALVIDDTVGALDPVSQVGCTGSPVVFSTFATGAGPFAYQWRKNGLAIPGANAEDYVIASVQLGDEGDYDVVVTGACAATTTAAATLTLDVAVSASNPASQSGCTGTAVAFVTVASGSGPFAYQWKKNALAIPGATASTFTIPSIVAADAGSYSVEVTGACSVFETSAATLTVQTPTTASNPLPVTACAGTQASFSTVAGGTGPFAYQWKKNALAISGANASTFTLPSISAADAGSYSVEVTGACGVFQTSAATLTVRPPTSASNPLPVTACSGTQASFATVATGAGTLGYQWKKDGVDIPGANAASYSIPAVAATDAGSYAVQVTGACGSVLTAAATLTVELAPSATDPVDVKACPGTSVSFDTVASGSGPFTYQWFKDGAPIPGATGPSHTIPVAASADKGDYRAQVTGACGTVLTASARLTLGVDIVSYCTSGTSASGCRATLAGSGTPSATASSGFVVIATGVEGSKDGIFFFGKTGRQANTWGNSTSFQCVLPPVKRGGLLDALGTNGQCNGLFAQDLNAHWQAKPSHNPGAGELVQVQLWYRDPLNTSNQSTSFSDALEFPVCP